MQHAGDTVANALMVARENALTKNRQVNVRFIQSTSPTGQTGLFGVQSWIINDANVATPLTKVTWLPDGMAVAANANLSPLLAVNSGTMQVSGVSRSYFGFNFLATGAPNTNAYTFVTVVAQKDIGAAAPPTNFRAVWINPGHWRNPHFCPVKTPTHLLHYRRRRSQTGVALIIVLFVMLLLVGVVVAFLSSVQTERATATTFLSTSQVQRMADSVVGIAETQISNAAGKTNAAGATEAWISQPGMVRTYNTNGLFDTAYKLYSATTLSTTDPTQLDADLPPSHLVDFARHLVRSEFAGHRQRRHHLSDRRSLRHQHRPRIFDQCGRPDHGHANGPDARSLALRSEGRHHHRARCNLDRQYGHLHRQQSPHPEQSDHRANRLLDG